MSRQDQIQRLQIELRDAQEEGIRRDTNLQKTESELKNVAEDRLKVSDQVCKVACHISCSCFTKYDIYTMTVVIIYVQKHMLMRIYDVALYRFPLLFCLERR